MLRSYLGPFLFTFFIALFILLMQFLWKWIDEFVGKGLEWDVLTKLLFYASTTFVPMALPLAILLSSIMVFGNLLGLIFNYGFGRIMGERVLIFIFKEKKFFSYQEKINNYGGYILLFGNIFPGPFEILSVFYGGFKYKFSYYLFLAMVGRLIKYTALFIAFYFYWPQIIFYWTNFKSLF